MIKICDDEEGRIRKVQRNHTWSVPLILQRSVSFSFSLSLFLCFSPRSKISLCYPFSFSRGLPPLPISPSPLSSFLRFFFFLVFLSKPPSCFLPPIPSAAQKQPTSEALRETTKIIIKASSSSLRGGGSTMYLLFYFVGAVYG